MMMNLMEGIGKRDLISSIIFFSIPCGQERDVSRGSIYI